MTWKVIVVNELTLNDLKKLLNRKIAGITIENFYPKNKCKYIYEGILNSSFTKRYEEDNVKSDYVGVVAVQNRETKIEYLERAAHFNELMENFYSKIDVHSPMLMVLKLIDGIWEQGAEIPKSGSRPYFAGILRILERSPLHNDFAKRDLPGWEVGGIYSQLAWNIYISEPKLDEGKTILWNRFWQPEDEKFKHSDPSKMGYEYEVVQNCDKCSITPKVGSLTIFNSTFYHEVLPASGDPPRISIGSFIGARSTNDPLWLWS